MSVRRVRSVAVRTAHVRVATTPLLFNSAHASSRVPSAIGGSAAGKAVLHNTDLRRRIQLLALSPKKRAELMEDAIQSNNLSDIQSMLEAGYDVNMVIRNPGEAWQMPLGSASGDGRIEVVGLLLGYGADVNAKDEFGSTALMRASMNGHTNVVQLLLKSGAAVNIQATFIRKTALMFASQYGHTNVVQLLLEYGADVSKSDEYDRTALALATAYGHVDVQNLLRQPGASA